jgi:2,3-dihydroxyethylbenzene 1,2-dioxygenase
MAAVTELGYLGFTITDVAAWRAFASDVAGLEVYDDGEDDRFYLRMDYWRHRMVMHKGDVDDLAYAGWRVADAEALAEIKAQLDRAGFAYRVGTLAEAVERRVLGLIKLDDPSGNPVEIFHGPLVQSHLPFHPGRRMHGKWVTGAQGLGHLLVRSENTEETYRFYSTLGLKGNIQYHLNTPWGVAAPVFMHCN